MQTNEYVIKNGEVFKKADVLKGTRDAELVDLNGVKPGGVSSVKHDSAASGLIYLGDEVEYGSFSRSVRSDKTGNFGASYRHIQILNGGKTAKVDAQMADFQNGGHINVALGDDVWRGDGNKLYGLFLIFTHLPVPPLRCF